MKPTLHFILGSKLKQSFFKEEVHHYIKKVKPFFEVRLLESKSEKQFQDLCDRYKHLYSVRVDEKGEEFSSEEFSKKLERVMASRKELCFWVGGPYGFGAVPKSDLTLSLSKMTFNHEMVPAILLEQLYRAHAIMKGLPYHHA